jgi:Tol biopolymer transport system component
MRVPRSLALATAVSVACTVGMTLHGSISAALADDPSASPSSQVVKPGEPWIAYVWDAEGVKVIRMVRPDGSGDHLAIGGAPADTEHPDWSPDGSRIAYMVDWSSIWIADADGSDAVRIATCAAPCVDIDMPAWSPDGTQIAFRTLNVEDGSYTGSAIEVVDLASGVTRTVSTPTAPQYAHWPRWSPDGSSMVVELERYESVVQEGAAETTPERAIGVIDLRQDPATAPTIITSWHMQASYPDWSPIEDRIVFATYDLGNFNETDEASNLFTVRPDGSALTQLTSFGPGEDRATQPFWTPNGQRIIFTWATGSATGGVDYPATVGFVDADGANLTQGLTAADPILVTHPRLRPTP